MRLLLIILLFSTQAFATDYYVSNSGASSGSGTAVSPISMTYYQTKNIVAGDNVYFHAGEVFNIALPVTDNSGTSGNRITYSSYGAGARPVFNALTTITTWNLLSGNIYWASVDVPRLQIVTVDGVLKGMGRYPKTGYLTIGSHSGLSSITSASVSGIPFDPAGSEAVVKKARYIIDRHPVTSRSGNVLNITTSNDFGPNGNYSIDDGNGFFIQSSLGTLTQLGDWYYDAAAKRLYVHFGGGNSSSHVIQASLVDQVANAQSKSYITFNGLDLRGGNTSTFNVLYSTGITITNCSITNGTEGVFGANGGGGLTVSNCYIQNMHSNGVTSIDANVLTVFGNTVRDIHLFPGMGRSGDAIGSGLSVTGGDNIILSNNAISKVGYCGIAEYTSGVGGGNNVYIENNVVDSFSINKDDAGGVYMYGQSPRTFANRRVRNNWVKNGIGNVEGVSPNIAGLPFACGVYLDNFSTHVNVEGNLITDNSGAGIFLHSTHTDTLNNNSVYNSGFEAFLLLSYGTTRTPTQTVTNLYVHHNQFIAKSGGQMLMDFECYNTPSVSTFGTFNNNTFYSPFGNGSYLRVDNRSTGGSILTDYTLPNWQSTYSKEQSSINSTVPIADASKFRVEYNPTVSGYTVNLNANYKDVLNTAYPGTMPLAPYSGRVLMYESALAAPLNNGLEIKFRKVQIYPSAAVATPGYIQEGYVQPGYVE